MRFQLIEHWSKLKVAEKEKQDELNTKYKTQLDEVKAKIEAANTGAEKSAGQIALIESEISHLDATQEELGSSSSRRPSSTANAASTTA